MKDKRLGAALIAGLTIVGAVAVAAEFNPPVPPPAYLTRPPPAIPVPSWAFAMDPPETADLKRRPDDDVPRSVPNSKMSLTRRQVLDHFGTADWHPEGHPPAPKVVMDGRKPRLPACAFCHLPNGLGLPENAPLAGLPAQYIVKQIHDYKDGTRKSADMRMASFYGMADYVSTGITEDELRQAAAYYASLKAKPYLTVIETRMVPKMRSIQYTMTPIPGAGQEPIGNRILETPKDARRADLLDSEVGYFVYVPVGSIKKGEVLVTTGGHGKTQPCSGCHGRDLRGQGEVPPIAGRGPSNIVRQLYNIKLHARHSEDVEPMLPVVAKLTDEDIVSIAAYLSSRKP